MTNPDAVKLCRYCAKWHPKTNATTAICQELLIPTNECYGCSYFEEKGGKNKR